MASSETFDTDLHDLHGATAHPHSAAHRALEAFGIAAAAVLVVTLAARVAGRVLDDGGVAFVLLGLALGAVAADLFSGVVHWGFDRFGDERTPFFGPAFVKPFRLHHTDPKDILRHGFLETNGNTSLATVLPLTALLAVPVDAAWGVVAVVTMTTASVLAVLTNQLHKWAHDPQPPRAVSFLQDCGLILGAAHHAEHHAWPHESHYCITTGWMNAVLPARVWRRLEALLERAGLQVHRG